MVVHSDTYTIADPEFEATVQNLSFGLAALAPDVVSGVSQYYNSGSDWQVSDDGHSTILSVTMSGTLDEAAENVSELVSMSSADTTGRTTSRSSSSARHQSQARIAEISDSTLS